MQLDSSGRPKIDVIEFRPFTQVSSWRSLALILGIYFCIFALGWIGGPLSHYWLALPAVAIIGALQHHLLILLHEGAHGLLHPHKGLNALITDVFCGIPFFVLGRVNDPEYLEAARKLTVDGYFFGKRPIFFEAVVEQAPKSPLAPRSAR
jgi:hypothetical protein